MAYCPKCLAEYREGLAKCRDCGCGLIAGATPPPAADDHPDTELVWLCTLADPVEGPLVKAALAEAGIDSLVKEHGPITARLTRVADGATHDVAIVYVTANRLEEARQVLAALRSGVVEWPQGMEPDESPDDPDHA